MLSFIAQIMSAGLQTIGFLLGITVPACPAPSWLALRASSTSLAPGYPNSSGYMLLDFPSDFFKLVM